MFTDIHLVVSTSICDCNILNEMLGNRFVSTWIIFYGQNYFNGHLSYSGHRRTSSCTHNFFNSIFIYTKKLLPEKIAFHFFIILFKIFKNSHPLLPLNNDEKLLLLKFVQEMELNTKYSEMDNIKQYLKTSWAKMAQLFADNNYDRNPEKLSRTYFHLKNHAKTHLERYYKNKESPKPHQIDYMFIKLYPNEFEIPGLDVAELQRKGLLTGIKEEDMIEIEYNHIEDTTEKISIKEEPLETSITAVNSNECEIGTLKRVNSDSGPNSVNKRIKANENESQDLDSLRTRLLLAEEKRKEHLYQMELKYKEDLFNIEKKYKEQLFKKEMEIKNFEIMLLRKKNQNKYFQCEICQKCFSNEEFLKIHYEAHLGEELQNSIFNSEEHIPKSILFTDISDNYLEKCRTTVPVKDETSLNFECSYIDEHGTKCSRRFGEKRAFDLHLRRHEDSNNKKIFCHICKIHFANDLKLFKHMKSKHHTQVEEAQLVTDTTPGTEENANNSPEDFPKKKEKTGFKCTICSKIFPVPAKLRTHIRTHTGEKPFKCDKCQKCFGTAGSLKDHSYLHLEERPFKCTICNKGFVKNNALENHIRSHTGEKPYECNICHKKYATPVILNQHLLAHSKKPFKCDVCNKSFIYLCTLKYHMVVHTDSKPFKCSYCDRSFSIRNSLNLHEREHTGNKLHKCNFCSKTFTTIGSLKKHERIHTGEKPYICKICNRGFTQSSALSRHVDSHSGEKPYVCHICNKGLTSSTYLKVHLRIHKGEPPYHCKQCDKTFTANLKYRNHVKQHKKDKEKREKNLKKEIVSTVINLQNASNTLVSDNAKAIIKQEPESIDITYDELC